MKPERRRAPPLAVDGLVCCFQQPIARLQEKEETKPELQMLELWAVPGPRVPSRQG